MSVPFLLYRQARHWARKTGQGMNLSLFWANLDHSDSCDGTFESTVESPRNTSLKKFPGVSVNAPGWAKVIRHLLISIPIKENLLLGKRKVQSYGPIWLFFFLSHIFWVHLCPRNISKISQTPWEGWLEITEMKEKNVCARVKNTKRGLEIARAHGSLDLGRYK